jgi:hypothetical protein
MWIDILKKAADCRNDLMKNSVNGGDVVLVELDFSGNAVVTNNKTKFGDAFNGGVPRRGGALLYISRKIILSFYLT